MRSPIGSATHPVEATSGVETDDGDDGTPPEDEVDLIAVDLELSEVLEAMECVNWRDVPEISTAEAAAWNSRLIEARTTARERADQQGVEH